MEFVPQLFNGDNARSLIEPNGYEHACVVVVLNKRIGNLAVKSSMRINVIIGRIMNPAEEIHLNGRVVNLPVLSTA